MEEDKESVKYRGCEPTKLVNYKKIPVFMIGDYNEFNRTVEYYENKKYFTLGIPFSPSHGIKYQVNKILPAYDVIQKNLGVELIVLGSIEDGGYFRLQYRPQIKANGKIEASPISGIQALHKFKRDLKSIGINLEDYYIDNGSEIKKTIPTYKIELLDDKLKDVVLEHAHHVDMHSSFPYGLSLGYPEFKQVIENYYNNRKVNPEYKLILNSMIGAMQSENYFKAKLAQMAKYAISTNNKRLEEMIQWLKDTGRTPVLLNTDGVWFIGEKTGLDGKVIGSWEEDHTDCTLRIKSKGCYEYIENGEYHPVARGPRKLDKIKDRTQWKWGDIYDNDCKAVKVERLDTTKNRIIEEYIDEEKLSEVI